MLSCHLAVAAAMVAIAVVLEVVVMVVAVGAVVVVVVVAAAEVVSCSTAVAAPAGGVRVVAAVVVVVAVVAILSKARNPLVMSSKAPYPLNDLSSLESLMAKTEALMIQQPGGDGLSSASPGFLKPEKVGGILGGLGFKGLRVLIFLSTVIDVLHSLPCFAHHYLLGGCAGLKSVSFKLMIGQTCCLLSSFLVRIQHRSARYLETQ